MKCHKASFWAHKKMCRDVGRQRSEVDRIGNLLKSCKIQQEDSPVNLFETSIGRFESLRTWQDPQPSAYLDALNDLMNEIWWFADSEMQWEAYEVVLDFHLEILRLGHTDPLRIRWQAPFALMIVDRDMDAYNFIKWWMKPQNQRPLKSNAKKGEWIYSIDQNRAEIVTGTELNTELAFLVALVGIKMRIVIEVEEKIKPYEAFIEILGESSVDSVGQELLNCSLAMEHIKKFVFGLKMNYEEPEDFLLRQKNILQKYLYATNEANETILPALVNPDPLMGQGRTNEYQRGSVNEAALVMRFTFRFFAFIPGAKMVIRRFLHPNLPIDDPMPPYNCSLE
jgi:hypothetical protein